MSLLQSTEPLLAYSDWQRQTWRDWFVEHGAAPLALSTGPNGDGRLPTIGHLIHHIFSAELRYVDRLLGREASDTSSTPTDAVAPLFALGARSREALTALLAGQDEEFWDAPVEFSLLNSRIRLTPRKVAWHVLTHELRHWAQVATYLRLNGHKLGFQDLLFSPVLGPTTRR